MPIEMPVYVGPDALGRLAGYLDEHDLGLLSLVADSRTYEAYGRKLEHSLRAAGRIVKTVLLPGSEVVADERYLVKLLLAVDTTQQAFLAVGAGTIHDIVRFVADRTRIPFISIPTAPSVDGFPSAGAPIMLDGFKQTIPARPPLAIFADLETLCKAPRPMIAAGFGDTIGKYTSLADWRLGQLLWEEPYDAAVAARTQRAVDACVARAGSISQADRDSVHLLTTSLVESGLSMAEVGHSRSASGTEHHLSHFWEMQLFRQGRPAVLHGAKVGVGLLTAARLYDCIRQMPASEARSRLASSSWPDPAEEARRIRAEFGSAAELVLAEQAPFLTMTAARAGVLRHDIVANWPRILTIAASVPAAQTLATLLRQVGGPSEVQSLGLAADDHRRALQFGHYLRDRFTVLKLAHFLGLLQSESVLASLLG